MIDARTISNMADRINLTKTIVERANTLFKMVHDGRNLKVANLPIWKEKCMVFIHEDSNSEPSFLAVAHSTVNYS